MRRLQSMLAAVAVTGVVAMPASGAGATPRDDLDVRRTQPANVLRPPGLLGHEWQGEPPYIAGISTFSRGEFIAQDRPFDDTGADTIPDSEAAALQHGYPGLCEATAPYRHGEYAYPDESYRRNGADLLELRLAADVSHFYVLFQVQTLIEVEKVAALLTVGEQEILVRGSTATMAGAPLTAAVDLSANTIEVRVPRSALPGGTWTISAATGVPGEDTAVTWVDAAFVTEPIVGELNCWQDKAQSALLAAGTFPTTTVDSDRLGTGSTDPPTMATGPMVRLHAPFFDNGEGLEPEPTHGQEMTGAIYRGKLQPYGAFVPASYRPGAPAPLLVVLHCLNCNHNTFHIAAWPGLRELAEQLGALVVTPLAYGEGRHYEEEAELDVLEVLADVSARYDIDPDRIYLSGMSMGALGTFRLGLLYPDLWARTLGVGNYTTPYCVSPSADACGAPNYTSLFANARNVPWGLLNGTLDELTPVTLARDYADRFTALGYAHRLWEYTTARHSPSLHGETVDTMAAWLGGARRITEPAHISYVVDPSLFDPRFGLVYDRAYWLRGIRLADATVPGVVEAVAGRGDIVRTSEVTGSGESDAGPYSMRGLDPVVERLDGANELRLTLTGVASLAVDVGASALSSAEPLTVAVDTDTPATVEIVGFGVVDAPSGASTVVLAPSGSRAAPQDESLPATGPDPWAAWAWLPAAGAVGAFAARRQWQHAGLYRAGNSQCQPDATRRPTR